MPLPNFDELKDLLARSKHDDRSWGNLFREISNGELQHESANSPAARIFTAKPSLIQILAEWDFYSSQFLDEAASDYGVKSWQVIEYVEGLREALSIGESDLIVYEKQESTIPRQAEPRLAPESPVSDSAQPEPRYVQEQNTGARSARLEYEVPTASSSHTANAGGAPAAPAVAAYAPAASPPPPAMPMPVPVMAVQQPNNGLVGGLIALVSLLAGALVVGLAWALMLQRSPQQASIPAPKQPDRGAAPAPAPRRPAPEPQQEPSPRRSDQSRSDQSRSDQWQACWEEEGRQAPPPQPGDVWWPVVGPAESLAAARRFCRADAYTNRSGNVQVASFRDRDTAEAFAEELSSDMSHPYGFWVGDPSPR
jgi:hypothetical protein